MTVVAFCVFVLVIAPTQNTVHTCQGRHPLDSGSGEMHLFFARAYKRNRSEHTQTRVVVVPLPYPSFLFLLSPTLN